MNNIQRPGFATLVQLAAEARGEDWADGLKATLPAAVFAGWTWERVLLAATLLIVDDRASGADLLHEVQGTGGQSCPPTPEWAAAKAALGRRRATSGDGPDAA